MSRFPRDEDGNLIEHVPGLEYYRDFLSPIEQDELLALIDANPWQEGVIARRLQFYGEVYYHTSFKSKALQGCDSDNNGNEKEIKERENESGGDENKNICNNNKKNDSGKSDGVANDSNNGMHKDKNDTNTGSKKSGNGIPMDESGMRKWLDKMMPLFEQEGLMEPPTQVLINEYKNNMGIASHFEDFDAFGPVILTVSLVSPVYMTLKKPTLQPKVNGENGNNINACDTYDDVVKVLMEPGSLLVMKDDARFKYRHGIGKYKWVNLPPSAGTETATRIKRDDSYRRVSLTVRHLLSTRRKVRDEEDESDTIKDPSVY